MRKFRFICFVREVSNRCMAICCVANRCMAICCAAVCCAAVCAPGPHPVTLRFRNMVGKEDLRLLEKAYTDPFGEPMTIYKFKYYVSHISVMMEDNTERSVDDGCHLIDEADALSRTIVVTFPALPIKSITFLLGVDSLKNVDGAQSGDLDPLKGMYWAWNTGYVDAELEGRSDSSHANVHFLSWHVGGYRQGQNAARKITLSLKDTTAGTSPSTSRSVGSTIIIDADILKWFDARHPVRIAQSPVCHEPGPLAMNIADNYSAMFSIEH